MAGNSERSVSRSGSQTYWSQLSDNELLKADLSVVDPQTLDNLLDNPLDTDEVPEIEFEYDTRMTGVGMVRCIHCKKTAKNHNRGFVLRFADGQRMLFGKDCGEKQYGAVFKLAKRDFGVAVKRKEFLERRLALLENKRQIVDLFERIEGDECWRAYGDLRRQFNQMMGPHSSHFAEAAARREGALYALQRIRDHEAEAAYEKRTGRTVQLFKKVEAESWRLKGRDLFIVQELPAKIVASLVHRGKGAMWKLSEEAGSDRDLQNFFTGMRNILAELREQADRIGVLPRAFSRDQIEGLSAWLHAHSEGSLLMDGRRIFRTNRHGGVRARYNHLVEEWISEEMMVPETFPTPPYKILEELERLI